MADNQMTPELYEQSVFEDGGQLVVNLEGVAEMKFEAIPKGIYEAEVDSVEFGMSNSSGKPMLTFMFAIINNAEYAGRKLYFYASFSEKALAGTKTALLRIDPTIFSGPFRPKDIADQGTLLGKQVRIKVTHEEYNGEQRSRIQSILAPASPGSASGGSGFFGG